MLKKILFATIFLAFIAVACAPSANPDVGTESQQPANGDVAEACLTGTWRVNPQVYAAYMDIVIGIPDITVTNIDKPFYYIFTEDGTFSIIMETVTITEQIVQASGSPNIMTFTMEVELIGNIATQDPATSTAHDGWLKLVASDVSSHLRVTSVKLNGEEIVTTGVTMNALIDPSSYTAVGYDCMDDTLILYPVISDIPKSSFVLTRDNTWTPSP
jgi:hypothetical protein